MSIMALIRRIFGFGSSPRALAPGDRVLRCEDCGKDFIFDEGEQQFFKIKGFTDPKRCPRCRKQVKFRLRRKKKPSNNGNAPHHRDRDSQLHRSRGRSLIDGRSPYADER